YRIGFSCAALLSTLAACQRDNDVKVKPSALGETTEADIVSSESASGLSEEKESVMLDFNWVHDPATLDPAFAFEGASVGIISELFIGLTRLDPENGDVIPYLATSWEAGEDDDGNQTWTFHLRDDVAWVKHDTETSVTSPEKDELKNPLFVNAHDVVFGVKRAINPATASGYAHVLYSIKNAEAVNSGKAGITLEQVGVNALDDRTVQFTMEHPAGFFPAITALWVAYPVPQWAIEEHGDFWADAGRIVTSGPYVLDSWIHGAELNMVKNPYWLNADSVQIDRIEGVMIEDATLSFYMYENGDLDIIAWNYPAYRAMKGDPALASEFRSWPRLMTDGLGFANNKYPFDDPRVRRAFTQAFDRQSYIDYYLQGLGFPATTFAPPGVFGAPEPGSVGLPYNPQAAHSSLQEYLVEKGMSLEQFNDLNITLMVPAGDFMFAAAQVAQQMWSDALGVEVQIQSEEYGVYLQTIDKSTHVDAAPHIFVITWTADYPDENNFVYEVFHAEEGFNWVRRNCLDPICQETTINEFDDLTMRARRAQDPEERIRLYREAERILIEVEVAFAPVLHAEAFVFMKPWLSRPFSPLGVANF
ncbi:MAG TPA: peptide ABC transporter substrate-binding protein, partial [candidate division Zixibacteria bacterium]|nr:peptide ABC transporter substrate-binding protein [candidate division Zixibacteria bacterium]